MAENYPKKIQERDPKAIKIGLTKAGLALSLVVFWGTAIASMIFNTEPSGAVMGLSFFATHIFSGIRASQLNRSSVGWVFGGIFSGTISSIVLLFQKKRISPQEIIKEQERKANIKASEKVILSIARKNKGFVTPGEVALEGEVSLDEAKVKLEELVTAGHAQMEVTGAGSIKYFFPEFAKDEDPYL